MIAWIDRTITRVARWTLTQHLRTERHRIDFPLCKRCEMIKEWI